MTYFSQINFFTPQDFLVGCHGYKAQIVSIWSVRAPQYFQNDVA